MDDDESIQMLYADELEQERYEVVASGDGSRLYLVLTGGTTGQTAHGGDGS